jgi:hypothetical protein
MNARKPLLTIGLWILIIGGAVVAGRLYQAHEKGREQARHLKQKTDKHEKELRIAEFAKRHNAIVGWEMTLPKRGGDLSGPFMIDLSRALSPGSSTAANEAGGADDAISGCAGENVSYLDTHPSSLNCKSQVGCGSRGESWETHRTFA